MNKLLIALQKDHKMDNEQISELINNYDLTLSDIVHISDVNSELYLRMANSPQNSVELDTLACDVFNYIRRGEYTHIIFPLGSPALMYRIAFLFGTVERAGLAPRVLFSMTDRISEDIKQPDGTVKKVSIFKHKGYDTFQ